MNHDLVEARRSVREHTSNEFEYIDIPTLIAEMQMLTSLNSEAVSYIVFNLRITQQCGNPVHLIFPGAHQCLTDAERARDNGKIQVYTRFLELAGEKHLVREEGERVPAR